MIGCFNNYFFLYYTFIQKLARNPEEAVAYSQVVFKIVLSQETFMTSWKGMRKIIFGLVPSYL